MTHTDLFLVAAAIIRRDNKILIAKRSTGALGIGKWEFPGGKIEFLEHPEECVVREVKEELDIEISVDKLYTISSYFDEKEGKKYHILVLAFFADYVSGEIVLNDHSSAEWVDISSLEKYEFVPADVKIVKELVLEN